MAEATLRHGTPVMIDYTPAAGAVSAGQVVLIGNTAGLTCGVAHLDIANGVLGALAAGGGVYDCINLNNAANGAKVWWDDSVNKVTTTSTNNALFGFVVSGGAGGANTICQALHQPYV
jgi:predicted RecA/RadA family phage recombinase